MAGRRDSGLAAALAAALGQGGFDARPDDSRDHGGNHEANLCNRGASRRGCQVEISVGLRRTLFGDVATRKGRGRPTESFAALVSAVRQVLCTYA